MWALWVSVFVKANIYKDNTTLKEIKDGQLAASLFFFIYKSKQTKQNKQAQEPFPIEKRKNKRYTYMQLKWKY